MTTDWTARLEKTRIALYRSEEFLWKTCIKKITKGDVWEIELQYYHIILNVDVKKLKDGKCLGFLRYKIKGLEQWQEYVDIVTYADADRAKQHTVLTFLSYLKSDDVMKFYDKSPLIEPTLPNLEKDENYQIQYELDGKLAGPPTDLQLFEKLKVVKLSGYNARTFRILISGNTKTKDDAIKESKKILNDYLDYYCLRTQIPIKILNNGRPHAIIFNNNSEMDMNFNSNVFVPEPDVITKFANELKNMSHKGNINYILNAMKYYRKASLSENLEDKLVNYFVALEALYSKNEQEITFRFSIRMSTFLEIDSDEIKKIFDEAQNYYRKRSTAVHGDITKIQTKDIEKIDNWVRTSILYFLELSDYFFERDLSINAIDYGVIDFEYRELLHAMTEPANEKITQNDAKSFEIE